MLYIILNNLNHQKKENFWSKKLPLFQNKAYWHSTINKSFKQGVDYFPTLDSDVFTIEERIEAIYNSTIKPNEATLQIGNDIYFNRVNILQTQIFCLGNIVLYLVILEVENLALWLHLQEVYLSKGRLMKCKFKIS